MNEDFLDVSSLIALRKNALYRSIIENISEDDGLSQQEKKKLNILISKMDFEDFMTKEEIESNTLQTDNGLQDLDIDKKNLLEAFEIELEAENNG